MLIIFLLNLGYFVDLPTTYILPRGSYDLEFRVGENGKIVGRIGVSPLESFMFGISYGGEKIIGSGTPRYNSSPEVQAKWGMAASNLSIALGYDSQSYGDSPTGVYGVLGGDLRWKFIPYIGLGYRDSFKPFCGVDAGLFPSASITMEGYFSEGSYGKDKEFMVNGGIRWIFEQQVIIEFDFKDIFSRQPTRALKFSCIGYI